MSSVHATQAELMLSLQSRMNAKVDPQWVVKRFPYLRAVVIEAAEAIEHHGWKWWKKQECDLAQLQMEIIDIWHFVLSEILLNTKDDQEQAARFLLNAVSVVEHEGNVEFDGAHYALDSLNLVEKLELLIGLSAAKRIDIALFQAIMLECQLDWDALYRQYVSKNVLNFFRQDFGYKDGTYLKLWHGREDNEHLVELMNSLDATDPSYPELLYQGLVERYPD